MKKTLLLTLLSISISVTAAPPPAGSGVDAIAWPASMHRKPTSGITLGKFHVLFEKTTLAQVKSAASAGEIANQGDAAGSISWLCYTISDRQDTGRLWITSGEMGGRNFVTGISARSLENMKPSVDCPLLPKNLQLISLDVPVWLGSSDSQLWKVLGQPSHAGNGWREYDFRTKVVDNGKCEGGYDLINSLSTKSKKGKIIAIDAEQVTSC